MPAAVLLPALFIVFHAERFFFTVADGLDVTGIDSRGHQCILYRSGALITQSQIVLGRTAIVAVSLNCEGDIGMLREELNVCLQRSLADRDGYWTCRSRNKYP